MNQVSDINLSLREDFNTVNRISEVGTDAFALCEESHNSLETSDDTNELRISAGNAKESSIKLDDLSYDAILASEHAKEKVPLNDQHEFLFTVVNTLLELNVAC